MLRRVLVLLVMSLGLLGVTAPPFACTVAPADMDCCPPDAPPCPDEKSAPWADAATAVCCIAVPAPSRSISATPSSTLKLIPVDDLDSPHAVLPSTPAVTEVDAVFLHRPRLSADSRVHTDAALTYLRTGRLRL